jgi:hypothetical protein
MRGIAKGQTITMLVIPEVQQLMKRQLSKARQGKARPAGAGSGSSGGVDGGGVDGGGAKDPMFEAAPSAAASAPSTAASIPSVAVVSRVVSHSTPQGQLLQDVAAWLTINSMRTERVQFDQLCAQNLATLWRQNAWMQLLEGKEHFKVRPECVAGFMQEKLGEAYVSNRLGKVSRERMMASDGL